jgi:hypothetical protein
MHLDLQSRSLTSALLGTERTGLPPPGSIRQCTPPSKKTAVRSIRAATQCALREIAPLPIIVRMGKSAIGSRQLLSGRVVQTQRNELLQQIFKCHATVLGRIREVLVPSDLRIGIRL